MREGRACRKVRDQYYISLSELAQRTGLPQSTIALFENGGTILEEERVAINTAMGQFFMERRINCSMLTEPEQSTFGPN